MASTSMFETALAAFVGSLSTAEKEKFAFSNVSEVYQEIDKIQKSQESRGLLRNLRRVHSFVDGLNRYSQIIEQFVSAKPTLLAFIWGPVKFLLQVTSTHVKCFDTILDALRKIGDALPRFSSFETIFAGNTRIWDVLLWLYTDILEFYSEILKFFRKKAWERFFFTMWSNFDLHFTHILNRLARHTDLVDSEAAASNFDAAYSFRVMARHEFKEAQTERRKGTFRQKKEWLCPLSFEHDLQRCEDTLADCANTGRWFLRCEKFTSWMDPDNAPSILWLSGIPGSGKTTLSYIGFTHLKVHLRAQRCAVFPLFLSDRNKEIQTATAVLRSVIFQILEADQTLLPIVDEVNQNSYPDLRALSKLEEIVSTLLQNTESKKVYLILDGLDEIDDKERGRLVPIILRFCDSGKFKLLVSSRALADLKASFSNHPLITSNEHNQDDISLYVRSEQRGLEDLFLISQREAESILQPISERAKGMFLFARLVITSLRDQTNVEELREAARDIPHGLGEAYARILMRIKYKIGNKAGAVSKDILEFLLCVRKPPRERELKYAISIQDEDLCFNNSRIVRRGLDELCGPILEIRDGLVSFVHFTAKEYLSSTESGPYLEPSKAHYKMAMRCLTFLQFSCFKRDITDNEITQYVGIGEYLWLEYAQAHWLEHVQLGSKADHDSLQRLNNALRGFVVRWKKSGASEQPYSETPNRFAFGFGALKEISLETYQMLVSGAMYKSQKRFHEDIKDPFTIEDFAKYILQQLAHHASLLSGSENRQSLEDLYLFYGANVFKCQVQYCPFSVNGFRFKAEYDLHSKGHEKKFKCHIKACSYSEIGFLTAGELRLHVSCHSTIETTTDQISNLRLSQDPFRAPRQRRPDELFEDAVTSGDMEFIASAIEVDESKISEYRSGKFTLNLAIENNQVQIVELLLDKGVDFIYRERRYSSPAGLARLLELAVERGSIEMVRALLLRIPVIDEEEVLSISLALFQAVDQKEIMKVELLLAFGADPLGTKSGIVETPLEAAIKVGDKDITRLLLDCVTGVDNSSRNMLFHALQVAEGKDAELFQLVLKECLAKPMDWNKCIFSAIYRRHFQCARIAVEQGADVNSLDSVGRSALFLLAQESSLKAANLMKFLLENGADPSIKPERGRIAGDYSAARNIHKRLGVTWDELVKANAHKVIKPSDSQTQDEVLATYPTWNEVFELPTLPEDEAPNLNWDQILVPTTPVNQSERVPGRLAFS